MSGPSTLKKMWPRDPNMRELIESLWREYYGLYAEKYNRDPEKWLLNKFSEDIEFGQVLGQDHFIEGNRSAAIGQGHNPNSFLEIILGTYATIGENQNPEEWIATDRLLTLGNGPDASHRSLVFEIFKSGFFKFLNGVLIGKYDHRDIVGILIPPPDWTLSLEEEGLSYWRDEKWNLLSIPKATDQEVITAGPDTVIDHYLAPDHLDLLEAYCVGGNGDDSGLYIPALDSSDMAMSGVMVYADQIINW